MAGESKVLVASAGYVQDAATGLFLRSPRAAPSALPRSAAVAIVPRSDGRIGKNNVELFRNWSLHSEWIRGAINIRRSQVSSAEWDIVPFDATRPFSKRLQAKMRAMFIRPNPRNDSFRSFIEPVIEDIIVLDAGVIEKERTLMGQLVHLWPTDGGTIRINAFWDGSNASDPRYYWYPDYQERASFRNEDMVYIMANPLSWSPIGVSPLETLKMTIEAEMYGHEYNRRQVTGAAPDGVMDLGEDASRDDVRKFESFFMSEVAGKGAIGFVGGTKNAKWIPLRGSNRDMQFLEWQIYLVRKIAVVLGLSPQDLGVTFDVNKSSGEVQMQFSEDRGLRPLMSLVQDYLTEEIVWDATFGGPDNNLAFRFTALNLKETKAKADINAISVGVPYKSINEARVEDGRTPWGDPNDETNPFNKPILAFPQGVATLDDIPNVRELIELLHAAPAGGSANPGNPKGAASGA